MKYSILLVSNSPGEVTTFVAPVVKVLQQRHPDWELTVCLVPCPYATGAEAGVIRGWDRPPTVWTPWQTVQEWFKGRRDLAPGLVVFLGGDPWHALVLKRRFGLRAMAYFPQPSSWEPTRWLGGFDRVARGYGPLSSSPGPSFGCGDLRVDAVNNYVAKATRASSSNLTLALFPGSRWMHLKAVLGPYLRVADRLSREGLEVVLACSPFVTVSQLQDAAAHPWKLGLAYSTALLQGDTLLTQNGNKVRVVWGNPYEVMAACDLAMSLPGTNTAELAIVGKPTVVPLSARVPIGGGGLLGVLDRLPGFSAIKSKLHVRKKERLVLVALPNQLAGREIMPELVIQDDLEDLVSFMDQLLRDQDRRVSIGRQAQEVMGPPGAAVRLVDAMEQLL